MLLKNSKSYKNGDVNMKHANRNITAFLKKIEDLEKENHLFKSIIDNVSESVFAVNKDYQVIIYNKETERLEGMRKETVLGKRENEIYPDYIWAQEVTQRILENGKPLLEQSYRLRLPNGQTFNTVYSSYPCYYNGKIFSVYTIQKRISDDSTFKSKTKFYLNDIIGDSLSMKETLALAHKVARHNSNVLIYGETGTGKELLAQGMHNASLFSKGSFIPVNCAAIPNTLLESILFGTVKGAFTGADDIPGLFEQAENGTIFLDEINSMDQSLQAKLLRVLQDKVIRRIGSKTETQLNCRIISATNVDPVESVNENVIRSDLYYRLATVNIELPPLRKRKGDIEKLAIHFIGNGNKKFGLEVKNISNDLNTLFKNYGWPGNIRELENLIESGMHFVEPNERILEIHHLPQNCRNKLYNSKTNSLDGSFKGTLSNSLLELEKKIIQTKLLKYKGNITKTAQELGISRQNLHYKIKTLSIKK